MCVEEEENKEFFKIAYILPKGDNLKFHPVTAVLSKSHISGDALSFPSNPGIWEFKDKLPALNFHQIYNVELEVDNCN